MVRAVEERKLEERKRKVERLHEQAKKREEVLQRGKQLQQDKELKNQLRVSDNQQTTTVVAKLVKQPLKQPHAHNNSTTFNGSMNDTTMPTIGMGMTYNKTPYKLNTSGQNFDTAHQLVASTIKKKIITKTPGTMFKKYVHGYAPSNEYTYVVDPKYQQHGDLTLPSSATVILDPSNGNGDWTILVQQLSSQEQFGDGLDTTITELTNGDGGGDYGLADVMSDRDSDNENEDQSRVPTWARENLYQTFWLNQGHWYLSQRTFKLVRRTFGHYNNRVKNELQNWLQEFKSSKPLSDTLDDATYLEQTHVDQTFFY